MSTITIYQPLEYPSPNDYDDVQTMFRRVARASIGIKEIELYKAIMAVEV
jgi:hypothetical protein